MFDQEVNDMFQRYDTDGNGQIDKEEFRAVVQKMKSSSRRREVLSVAAATFGSLFVASGSDTFQYAPKKLKNYKKDKYSDGDDVSEKYYETKKKKKKKQMPLLSDDEEPNREKEQYVREEKEYYEDEQKEYYEDESSE